MAGGLKLQITMTGLNEIVARLKADVLVAEPWAEAMEEIGRAGQAAATAAAPRGKSGRTVSLMYHRVQSRPIPLWVKIGTSAAADAPSGQRAFAKSLGLKGGRKGSKLIRKREGKRGSWSYPYSYPRRVNFDPASRHYGWFTNAIQSVYDAVDGILDRAAKQIEERWSN